MRIRGEGGEGYIRVRSMEKIGTGGIMMGRFYELWNQEDIFQFIHLHRDHAMSKANKRRIRRGITLVHRLEDNQNLQHNIKTRKHYHILNYHIFCYYYRYIYLMTMLSTICRILQGINNAVIRWMLRKICKKQIGTSLSCEHSWYPGELLLLASRLQFSPLCHQTIHYQP